MSTKSIIKSIIQEGDKSLTAMYKAYDNANEVAVKKESKKKEDKKK